MVDISSIEMNELALWIYPSVSLWETDSLMGWQSLVSEPVGLMADGDSYDINQFLIWGAATLGLILVKFLRVG